jgi:hypothetical protein
MPASTVARIEDASTGPSARTTSFTSSYAPGTRGTGYTPTSSGGATSTNWVKSHGASSGLAMSQRRAWIVYWPGSSSPTETGTTPMSERNPKYPPRMCSCSIVITAPSRW